ncbi:MAG: AAA family ATPase [Spirochaetaceae bacterium]|nr:AAA family ATPase [Spirochaetaceae bacterium]
MFARLLRRPRASCFLFGPRGTGKSTWIGQHFAGARIYDLLDTSEALRLAREPATLFREVEGFAPGTWVVIDEVQRVPALLDEVHRLIESRRLRFVLSGSSARKLRSGGVNLLAGRAMVEHLYPLVSAERSFQVDLDDALRYGTLPLSITGDDPAAYLTAYAETYLQEEIRAEALTRSIGGFSRFLEIAARQNGQVTNVSAISRDAAVSRSTVQNYFEILIDTLIGTWLPAWKLKRSTKQVAHPKFYLFDCGVARALSARIAYPPSREERGSLLETLLIGEVRAYVAYGKLRYPLHYWRTHDGVEVDLLCETTDGFVAVEVKASKRWDRRYNRGLNRIRDELGANRVTCYGVYEGERPASWGGVQVLPALEFLQLVWDGEVLR